MLISCRLQRALSSKEEIIKDLKNKQHTVTLEPDHADTDGGDITSLTPLDLRKRYEKYEIIHNVLQHQEP